MLINSVIIVLREVLEAALMVSVLLAVSRILQLDIRWLRFALVAGLGGAAIYGHFLDTVSELFEGVGQELFNASLQFSVLVFLVIAVFLIARQRGQRCDRHTALPIFMALAVALAITREGAEVLIYVTGFWQMSDFLSSVGVGSLAGAAIGCSVGVLFYYLLLAVSPGRALLISVVLLGLAASGMSAQATGLLIQADWLSVDAPIWNSSGFIAEDSLTGQLLYALIGYEASPSAVEVATYASSIAVMALSAISGWTLFAKRGSDGS
jgi:high-affinity iron transporter